MSSTTTVLGLSGSFSTDESAFLPRLARGFLHDSAACLLSSEGAYAAVEEERLNRDKHTNQFPVGAIASCLASTGTSVDDLSGVAIYWGEASLDGFVSTNLLRFPQQSWSSARGYVVDLLMRQLGRRFTEKEVRFWPHHRCHAASTYFQSDQTDALVVTVDGMGDSSSMTVYHGRGAELRPVQSVGIANSLGQFYREMTYLLGYRDFDEYKVMGLAPYGDRERYAGCVEPHVALTGDGSFVVNTAGVVRAVLADGYVPRRDGEEVTGSHAALAATAQATLESVVLHTLVHWRAELGCRTLCLAGGVALNSTLVGVVLESGLFDTVHVQPASHDAGAALGAAALSYQDLAGRPPRRVFGSVYLGPGLGTADEVERTLQVHDRLVSTRRPLDVVEDAARAIAEDRILAWVQGRSEFGPRALGNRSILAAPRDPAVKDRINAAVKQRESYRPFAPAVTAEAFDTYFERRGPDVGYRFMGSTVRVRDEHRAALGAVTHVDGSARAQLVTREDNPLFWRLINRVGELTGVPVVLNTSFNHASEPIVQSVDDAVSTFLLSGLDVMFVEGLQVDRLKDWQAALPELRYGLQPFTEASRVVRPGSVPQATVARRGYSHLRVPISDLAFDFFASADEDTPLAALQDPDAAAALSAELVRLVRANYVRLGR